MFRTEKLLNSVRQYVPADIVEAQAAEIERLREALRGMIDYSCYSERWQDDHPEYVAAARAALGETE
jgi:hypothetical protein